MKIFLQNLKYEYEIHMLINSFKKLDCNFFDAALYEPNLQDDYIYIFEESTDNKLDLFQKNIVCISKIGENSYNLNEACLDDKKEIRNCYKRLLYSLLSQEFNKKQPWGILTGIRPVKIINELRKNENHLDMNTIKNTIKSKYLISDEKVDLMEEVSDIQKTVINKLSDDSYSIYIGIPFCPSRCNYCSFFSNDIRLKGHLRDSYLDALEKEISGTVADEWFEGKRLDSLYVGGGTPTALEDHQIERLLKFLDQTFKLDSINEITFEAGRPDTITDSKLQILKKYGINRISINPQTMVDRTLVSIGRNHDSKSIEDVYYLARKHGFENINMDIILGLSNEDIKDVEYTLKKLVELNPDSITMHTLSIKRASKLHEEPDLEEIIRQEKNIMDMVSLVYKYMGDINMKPYYLYRQKNILGGFENVGFAKENKESWYNIVIMEELQNILAFGSGSVSRFVYPSENRIERVSNIKNLESYIDKIEDMINKKRVEMKL
ncbi:MAG: coproporphyrinogen dehydrogenase HemZ [Proteocatella sp.]